MKPLEENKLVPVAMDIIFHAGNARTKASEALACAKKLEFAQARICLEEADNSIINAHHAQTDVIQREMAGEEREELVLIFVHAQNTLMSIRSEVRLTADMIELFEIIAGKLDLPPQPEK